MCRQREGQLGATLGSMVGASINWFPRWKEGRVRVLSLCEGCRNLPFGERATRGSRERLPRKENARSRHQCIFEENIRKTKSGSMNFKYERFGSCLHTRKVLAPDAFVVRDGSL